MTLKPKFAALLYEPRHLGFIEFSTSCVSQSNCSDSVLGAVPTNIVNEVPRTTLLKIGFEYHSSLSVCWPATDSDDIVSVSVVSADTSSAVTAAGTGPG